MAQLGHQDPFGLPGPAVPLVVADHGLGEHAGRRAHQPGQGDDLLAALGVALVGHGDAADRGQRSRLGHLADLAALQVVDLVGHPGQRGRGQGGVGGQLGHPVPGGEPGDGRLAQAQAGAEAPPQLGAGFAVEAQRPHRPGELPDQQPGPALAPAVEVAGDLVGPRRRLEPEGDGRAGLAVGPPGHGRVAVAPGQLQQAALDRPQVSPHQRPHRLHLQGQGGVGDVLHGGAVVDVLPGGLGQPGLQLAHQPQGGVRRAPGLGRHRHQVQFGRVEPGDGG